MHDLRPGLRLRAAHQRAHPRREFGHRKRLRHVIVGAQIKAAHTVVERIARRKHQDRDAVLGRPHPPQHLETVDARKSDVEDHQVEALLPGAEHRMLARGHHVHRVAFALENVRDPARQRRVVLDNQDPHPVNHTVPKRRGPHEAGPKTTRHGGRR